MSYTGHVVVNGKLGEGKSALGMSLFGREEGGALWWDPSDDQAVPEDAVAADPRASLDALTRALRAGRHVVWHAGPLTERQRRVQVDVLATLCGRNKASLYLDEAHLVYGQGRPYPTVHDLVMRGRHLGCNVVLMDPSPQGIDKSIYRLATLYLFDLEMIGPWLAQYAIPDDAVARVRAAGRHYYVRIQGGQVDGPHKLQLAS